MHPGAPGLGEVTSGYDENDVLNMKISLSYPTGFDSTSESLHCCGASKWLWSAAQSRWGLFALSCPPVLN